MLQTKPDYEKIKIIHEALGGSKVNLPSPNYANNLAFELYNFMLGFPDDLDKNVSRAMRMALGKEGAGLSKSDWKSLKNHLVQTLG